MNAKTQETCEARVTGYLLTLALLCIAASGCRAAQTRGLNRNHNRVVKNLFKGAALAAIGRPGALQDLYHAMTAHGMRKELARVTLSRKLAAVTLHVWKTGERYDPSKLTKQTR